MMKGYYPLDEFVGKRTPFYFYDLELLDETIAKVKEETGKNPNWRVHYAIKANFNPVILKRIALSGFGADCVSGGEIKAAADAGFPASSIFFTGVGKRDDEIEYALEIGIGRFNVESLAELEVINEIAGSLGKVAPIGLRVNPEIGAHTHANIVTGLRENKFGINLDQLFAVVLRALEMKNVKFKGLHFHIGSQITDLTDFKALCNRINDLQDEFDRAGIAIEDINVGGGLGIEYHHPNHLPMADFKSYFEIFRKGLKLRQDQLLHFEPGRSIVAPCGTLISRVLYIKEGASRKFAIIDASMTELIRPALYDAFHRIENLSSDEPEEIYDVVGPVCESSDVFAQGVPIDKCHRGDFVAIRSTGAYGESMASGYNCRPLPGSYFKQ